jgi:hypothetical protein
MAYSKAKFKTSGNKASPSSRPFWVGKSSDKCLFHRVTGFSDSFLSPGILENRKHNVLEMFTSTDFTIHFV